MHAHNHTLSISSDFPFGVMDGKWNLTVTVVAAISVSHNGASEDPSRIVKVPDKCFFILHVDGTNFLVRPILWEGLELECIWSYILYL